MDGSIFHWTPGLLLRYATLRLVYYHIPQDENNPQLAIDNSQLSHILHTPSSSPTTNPQTPSTATMTSMVSYLLETNQPVSDARLVQEVHYLLRVMTFYVSKPLRRKPTSKMSQEMFDVLYIVLDAAEKRNLQHLLPFNALGRLHSLLHAIEGQMAAVGQVAKIPASCGRRTNYAL